MATVDWYLVVSAGIIHGAARTASGAILQQPAGLMMGRARLLPVQQSFQGVPLGSQTSAKGDKVWTRDFARTCMDLMLALPEVPTVLSKDKSRYASDPEKYPALNKLNKCFEALELPYRLDSEQRRYENKRKKCWKLVKFTPGFPV